MHGDWVSRSQFSKNMTAMAIGMAERHHPSPPKSMVGPGAERSKSQGGGWCQAITPGHIPPCHAWKRSEPWDKAELQTMGTNSLGAEWMPFTPIVDNLASKSWKTSQSACLPTSLLRCVCFTTVEHSCNPGDTNSLCDHPQNVQSRINQSTEQNDLEAQTTPKYTQESIYLSVYPLWLGNVQYLSIVLTLWWTYLLACAEPFFWALAQFSSRETVFALFAYTFERIGLLIHDWIVLSVLLLQIWAQIQIALKICLQMKLRDAFHVALNLFCYADSFSHLTVQFLRRFHWKWHEAILFNIL